MLFRSPTLNIAEGDTYSVEAYAIDKDTGKQSESWESGEKTFSNAVPVVDVELYEDPPGDEILGFTYGDAGSFNLKLADGISAGDVISFVAHPNAGDATWDNYEITEDDINNGFVNYGLDVGEVNALNYWGWTKTTITFSSGDKEYSTQAHFFMGGSSTISDTSSNYDIDNYILDVDGIADVFTTFNTVTGDTDTLDFLSLLSGYEGGANWADLEEAGFVKAVNNDSNGVNIQIDVDGYGNNYDYVTAAVITDTTVDQLTDDNIDDGT